MREYWSLEGGGGLVEREVKEGADASGRQSGGRVCDAREGASRGGGTGASAVEGQQESLPSRGCRPVLPGMPLVCPPPPQHTPPLPPPSRREGSLPDPTPRQPAVPTGPGVVLNPDVSMPAAGPGGRRQASDSAASPVSATVRIHKQLLRMISTAAMPHLQPGFDDRGGRDRPGGGFSFGGGPGRGGPGRGRGGGGRGGRGGGDEVPGPIQISRTFSAVCTERTTDGAEFKEGQVRAGDGCGVGCGGG